MISTDPRATSLQALDAQIQLAESRLIGREQLLRSQSRLLVTRVNDSLLRRLGQGALALTGALLLRRVFRPRAPAPVAQVAESAAASGLGALLLKACWPLLPKLLRAYISPALALSLLSRLRRPSPIKPTQDPI